MSSLIQNIQNPPQPTGFTLGCSKFITCVLPIAQIALGAVYLHECPKQDYIPIYLIVVGVFGLMLSLLACLPCAQQPKDGTANRLSQVCMAWNSLTSFFLFCWFIAEVGKHCIDPLKLSSPVRTGSVSNVWIYSIYQPNYNKTTTDVDPYCNKTVYLFAFWTTTLVYIFFGLFLFIGCCVMFCFFLCGRADPDD